MSIADELRETFRKAALQHEAAKGLGSEGWARYREILADHERLQRQERHDYYRQYQMRVEVMRARIIDKAASRDRPLLPRLIGRDRFSRAEIDRLAHRAVRMDHERTLSQLSEERDQRISELLEHAEKRRDMASEVKTAFADAADRRSGADRRAGPKRLN
jgi:hypothetical protein